MKAAGFFLLVSGWMIVLCALALLASASPRAGFALAGLAIEVIGLVLVFRSHFTLREERR